MQKERIFTKNFVTVSIINASVSLGVFLLFVVIAPYAVEELNASLSVSGLMVGIFVIGVLFGRLLTGKYINIVGNKKSLVIGVLLIILTTSFYFFTWNLYILFFY